MPDRVAPLAFWRGRSGGKRSRPAMAVVRSPSVGGGAAFTSRRKIAGARHPPLRSGPPLRFGCRAGPPAALCRQEGRDGAVDTQGAHDRRTRRPATNPRTPHPRPIMCSTNSNSTATDPSRTNPIRATARRRRRPGAIADIFDALVATLPTPVWSPTSKSCSGRRSICSIAPPTGSSASSTTTSRRSAEPARAGRLRNALGRTRTPDGRGLTLIERRNGLEFLRDQAADHFEVHTGSAWRPRSGSMVNHAHDRGADRQPGLPRRQTPRRHRGAAARRTEDRLHRRARLQRSSADLGPARQGPRQASRHGAAAWRIAEGRRTHRRQMGRPTARCRRSPSSPTGRSTPRPRLSSATTRCSTCCRSASCVFPGNGIQDNLADKAKKLGIPVWKFGGAARERRLTPRVAGRP